MLRNIKKPAFSKDDTTTAGKRFKKEEMFKQAER
jgi:hypothetical protein